MFSLDAAFLAGQRIGARHSESWGERFFQELSLKHPEWAGQKLKIYMKASEILHYFAFFERAEEMVPAFDKKPEALLRMVLMLLHQGEGCPWTVEDVRGQRTEDRRRRTEDKKIRSWEGEKA